MELNVEEKRLLEVCMWKDRGNNRQLVGQWVKRAN